MKMLQITFSNSCCSMKQKSGIKIIAEDFFCKVHKFFTLLLNFLNLNTVCTVLEVSQHPLSACTDSHKPPFDPFKLFSRTIAQ